MLRGWHVVSLDVKPLVAAAGLCSASAAAALLPPCAACLLLSHEALPAVGYVGLAAAEPCLDQAEGQRALRVVTTSLHFVMPSFIIRLWFWKIKYSLSSHVANIHTY